MTLLLDGKAASQALRSKLSIDLKKPPHVVFILVGNHPSSLSYVSIKKRTCEEVSIRSTICHLAEDISEKQLLMEITHLNSRDDVDGILVQLPLPQNLRVEKILEAIDPKKDVDCLHPYNLGRLAFGDTSGLLPCTPYGILELMRFYDLDLMQKEVCIVGRSSIVGRPLSLLLSQKSTIDATVTLCHQGTKDLFSHTKRADILIAAVGRCEFIKKEHIKEGAIVIDVGITRQNDRLVGDVDFVSVKQKASAITPVPGGVGPMTVYALLQNSIKAHKQRKATV
ncbi:MAG: bifunctional 5,10-methylenetetrahydrofolate dehydrogenase/5,10-methenyltetrahydrofolate cyclohydrolase [Chlamydiae bacterium]|nr:bifunctional 5,10-methylenetetrahydrofolate dehydrogenase/5,10-methenyltetrahydrofolate cyclohydrolase [Chlamydiota bacterium]